MCMMQVNLPLDLQDALEATTDASLKTVQSKGVTNPIQLAMSAGKPVTAAQAPLTAFQNILVVRTLRSYTYNC